MITVFSKASLPVEKGVGCIYSQSRGRGHRKFFWGLRPQTPSGSRLLFSPPNPKCAPRSLVSTWDNQVTLCHNYLQVTLEQGVVPVSSPRGLEIPGRRPAGASLSHG